MSGRQHHAGKEGADGSGDLRPDGPRLRHCANPECSLIFYDTARNGTRRWCFVAACGNRHKVRSHRMRAAKLECS